MMEDIVLMKNQSILDGFFVTEGGTYRPEALVPCSNKENGEPICCYQANYIVHGTHV